MPLTKSGGKIMRSMKKQYGAKKGKQVFYASINKKKLPNMRQQTVTSFLTILTVAGQVPKQYLFLVDNPPQHNWDI